MERGEPEAWRGVQEGTKGTERRWKWTGVGTGGMALLAFLVAPGLPAPELPGASQLNATALWAQDAVSASDGDEPARLMVQAHRIQPGDGGIQIDGSLDEPAWQSATPITDFTQRDPVEGGEPSEPTEVYVLYDEDNLYIGAILYDSEPDGILGHQLQRNAGLGTDDRFMWVLDTFREGRSGYFFEINPAGLMGDGLITGGGGGFGINKSWDGIWEVRTQITDYGWTAEIRIPFSTLNFDPTLDAWGINFQRTIRRKNEEILWSGWRRNQAFTRPINAGLLTGLDGISQGLGLEATPYISGNWSNQPNLDDPRDLRSKVGGDLEYSLTPSLRVAATVNTDFAEVEVDDRIVNLSRFPISFPEQRAFFLENSGVFGFAPRQGVNPFHSRRIGLVDGEEIPIHFGARLGGQAGRYELGAFQVRTGRGETVVLDGTPHSVPSEDFTAARVKRNIFNQSHVGAIYTRRATHANGTGNGEPPPDRHTAGMDFDFFTSEFLGQYNLQFEGFYAWHSDPVHGGASDFSDRQARGVRFNFPNDVWRFHSSLREFGEEFNPALGFQNRSGYRRLQPTFTYAPYPESLDWVRQLQWGVAFEYLTSLEGELLTRETQLTLLDVGFESGDQFSVDVTRLYERLRNPFRIQSDIVIPPGGYNTTDWGASFRTAGRRVISGNMSLSQGGFWSGDRTRFNGGVTARPRPGVSFRTQYQRNEVRLDEGGFDTNLVQLSGNWNLSPLTSFTTSVQYDDRSDVVGLFARARWIVRPGNDIFFVYSHNWLNEADRLFDRHLTTVSQGMAVKVNYSYRF